MAIVIFITCLGAIAQQSFSLGLLTEGHLTNLSGDGMAAHVGKFRNLPMVDTLSGGRYHYNVNGARKGVRIGLTAQTQINDVLAIDAQFDYTWKGETINFISTATAEFTTQTDFTEGVLLLRYYPPILRPLNLSMFAGSFVGFPTSTREDISVNGVVKNQPIRIHQQYDLSPWLPGNDIGLMYGSGIIFGSGLRRVGLDVTFATGITDLRGNTASFNTFFPEAIRTFSAGLTLTSYMGLWKR